LPPNNSRPGGPKGRSPPPTRASPGLASGTPNRWRPPASASKPNRRSGEDRWKKLRACDWTTWARFRIRRRAAPVGGGSVARIWSQALAEAIRWLTGQMPQMRAMIDGQLVHRAALADAFEAAELGDVEVGVGDLAVVVELDGDLGVALDPGHGREDDFAGHSLCLRVRRRSGRCARCPACAPPAAR